MHRINPCKIHAFYLLGFLILLLTPPAPRLQHLDRRIRFAELTHYL